MSRQTTDTKMNRKKGKYSSILLKLYGMAPSAFPSECLMVCNAGLSLGINREDFLNFFGKYGHISSINLVSKESHGFIKYANSEDAEVCYTNCNGQLAFPQMKGPLYLLYLEKFPSIIPGDVFKIPPGCVVIKNFVSEEEANILLESVKIPLLEGGDLKQRRVAHFGYEFIYGENNINKDKPMSRGLPQSCIFIQERVENRGIHLGWQPDQLTVNQYLPGQGIPPHIDTHSAFEDPILSLSLNSDSVIEFRRSTEHFSVYLPQRSLLVMSGESRYAWTHGITSRKTDIVLDDEGHLTFKERNTRISFTFRRIRLEPCNCPFSEYCDSQRSKSTGGNFPPTDLENEYVHKVYENISEHFSRTRHKPWPAILELVKSLEPGSLVADIGCGNCKYFGHASFTYEIGCDHSLGLLSISRQRGFQSIRSNCLSLPFKDNIVDCVLCIAVIHHLASPDRRISAVKEILRVLSPKGKALIYVWAKDQKYQGKESNYLKCQISAHSTQDKDCKLLESRETKVELPIHINRTDFSQYNNDVFVPWKLKSMSTSAEPSSTYLRYYHVFDEGELESLCIESGAIVDKNYYDNGNWCCLISKPFLPT